MNEDLRKEVEAVSSIYGDECLVSVEDDVYNLHLPQQGTALRIQLPDDYPAARRPRSTEYRAAERMRTEKRLRAW
jgi:hypothetical protein